MDLPPTNTRPAVTFLLCCAALLSQAAFLPANDRSVADAATTQPTETTPSVAAEAPVAVAPESETPESENRAGPANEKLSRLKPATDKPAVGAPRDNPPAIEPSDIGDPASTANEGGPGQPAKIDDSDNSEDSDAPEVTVDAIPEWNPRSPWDEAGVEDFTLTECNGRTITRQDLLGRPWVACFVFTRCAGPCPRVCSQMKQLQNRLEGTDVQLVTFTVDPKNDTPQVLQKFAKTYGADPQRWWFLTGDQREIYGLIHRSFKMPVQETLGKDRIPGFEVIHSTNLMWVDAAGRVVDKFDARDDREVATLARLLTGKARRKDLRRSYEIDQRLRERDGRAEEEAAREAPLVEVPAWVLRLPTIYTGFNGLAAFLLLLGYGLVKNGHTDAHRRVMLTAFCISMLFLACYVVYHTALHQYTGSGSRKFTGTGLVKQVYLGILITHVVLAAAVPVLTIRTISLAFGSRWERHKRWARVTFPIWLYVSVTGVIIYFMLYHWPPEV
jgi:protein SCO1/2/putative membrane protein